MVMQVINSEQLNRIESVHRGFFYQHLYAVGCLLVAPAHDLVSLYTERDEDIELQFKERYLYIQVKTRKNQLQKADINDTLIRFSKIRELHSSNQRPSIPECIIVCNVPPGKVLLDDINSVNWAADVKVLWPDCEMQEMPEIPPAWSNPIQALEWCTKNANLIPSTFLTGETLTFKLAAKVQLACTGLHPYENHEFTVKDLPDLFEQIFFQLQDFPEGPTPYRSVQLEPPFESDQRVRLIIGHPGSGKTSWASQLALHNGRFLYYFSIGDTPGSALASALVREIAGKLAKQDKAVLGTILLPGSTGLDSLHYLSQYYEEKDTRLSVILDDVHKLPFEDIIAVVSAAPNINFILLARPWEGIAVVEAAFSIKSEHLLGWTYEEIAHEFACHGCPIDPQLSERITRLTGALPLFVQNAAKLSQMLYSCKANDFCDDLESLTHSTTTIQEIILQKIFEILSEEEQITAAIISISDVPLTKDEVQRLVSDSCGFDKSKLFQFVRRLIELGILHTLQGGSILVHDAFRVLTQSKLDQLEQKLLSKAYLALRQIVEPSVGKINTARVPLFLRLLPRTGEVQTLIDLSSFEAFYEMGYADLMKQVLEKVSNDENLMPKDRFWATDSLAFWDLQINEIDIAERRLRKMETLFDLFDHGLKETVNLYSKWMILYGKRGRIVQARRAFNNIPPRSFLSNDLNRVIHYNLATTLYFLRQYTESADIVQKLIIEYYDVLGLEFDDVVFKNPPEIMEKLKGGDDDVDNLKHLADCLNLSAMLCVAQGLPYNLARWHALKFYDMANAITSLIKTGQDIVDDFLGILHDPVSARDFIETTLLPLISKYKLLSYLAPVKGQYAVVLAQCGETELAIREIESVKAFKDALHPEIQADLTNQEEIVRGMLRKPSLR